MFHAPLTPEMLKAGLVIVLTVIAALAVLYFWQRTRREKPLRETDELMVQLRNRMLRGTPEAFKVTPSGRVWGLVMEHVRNGHITSLVALADGNASIIGSHGSAVVGAISREDVAAATRQWCELANGYLGDLLPAREFPFPKPRSVRFFALTTMGVRTAEVREQVLEKGEHRYSPMFAMGRMIFERLRNPPKQEARDSA
jgi:HAMP domain-containing protein